MPSRPLVSVIVPVYNESNVIEECLMALIAQTYPRYEILIVDNGSTDETQEIISEVISNQTNDDVRLIIEDEKQGSYAARNAGLKQATGEVIAFTDADCTPANDWLVNGVTTLHNQKADLVAGAIEFIASANPTAAEQFDIAFNLKSDEAPDRGGAPTANLFVRWSVIEDIGYFPTDFQSGADTYWTGQATDVGYSLVYAPDAIVNHPTRNIRELLIKHHRIGWGQAQLLMVKISEKEYYFLKRWLKNFIPCVPFYLHKRLFHNNIDVTLIRFYRILVIVWICQISQNIGRAHYFIDEHLGS